MVTNKEKRILGKLPQGLSQGLGLAIDILEIPIPKLQLPSFPDTFLCKEYIHIFSIESTSLFSASSEYQWLLLAMVLPSAMTVSLNLLLWCVFFFCTVSSA